MKKLLIALLAFGLLAVSCKKDSQKTNPKPTVANAEKHKVNLTVSQFSQTVGDIDLKRSRTLMAKQGIMANDASSLSDAINQYFYLVYDSNGNEVKRIYRTAEFPGREDIFHEDGKQYPSNYPLPGLETGVLTTNPFNVITDSLAAGTYTIVVTGSNKEVGINDDDTGDFESDFTFYNPLLPPSNRDSLSRAAVYVGEGLDALPQSQEIYFGKVQITVGDQNSTQSIGINRIVGQLEVNLEDAIPSNVAYIGVAREGEDEGYLFYNEVPFGPTFLDDQPINQDLQASKINAADRGKPNYKTDRFVLNTVTPINVKLIALDASFNVIVQKTVPNVRIYKNKRTILSGKLFSTGPATAQFTISANQAWGPDNPVIHF